MVYRAGSGQVRPHHSTTSYHRVHRSERSDLHRCGTRRQSVDRECLHTTSCPSHSRARHHDFLPTPATPTMIRPGNANNLLFTEFSANKIASITTNGVV